MACDTARVPQEMLKYSRSCAGAEHLQEALSSILGILKAVNDSMHLIAITGYDVRASVCRHRAGDCAEPCRSSCACASLWAGKSPVPMGVGGSSGRMDVQFGVCPRTQGSGETSARRAARPLGSPKSVGLRAGLVSLPLVLWGQGTRGCEEQTLFFPCVPELGQLTHFVASLVHLSSPCFFNVTGFIFRAVLGLQQNKGRHKDIPHAPVPSRTAPHVPTPSRWGLCHRDEPSLAHHPPQAQGVPPMGLNRC